MSSKRIGQNSSFGYHESPSEHSEVGVPDEDGIAKFLSDAIGQDADEEVLKDIGDSRNFAELFDVVTSALIPNSNPHSRRTSSQDSGVQPIENFAEAEHEPPVTNKQAVEDDSDEIPICRKRRRPKIEDDEDESVEEAPHTNMEPSTTIKNRLKVRLKVSSSKSKAEPVSGSKAKSTKETNKNYSPSKVQVVKSCNAEKSTTPINKRSSNVILHRECIRRHRSTPLPNDKRTLEMSPCCIIVYDILKTDKFIKMVTPPKVTKASSNSINLCKISDDKIEEFHKLEETNRLYYVNLWKSANNQKSKPGKKKFESADTSNHEPISFESASTSSRHRQALKNNTKIVQETKHCRTKSGHEFKDSPSVEKVKDRSLSPKKADNRDSEIKDSSASPIKVVKNVTKKFISPEELADEKSDAISYPAKTEEKLGGKSSMKLDYANVKVEMQSEDLPLASEPDHETSIVHLNKEPQRDLEESSCKIKKDEKRRRREKYETEREKDKKFERLESERSRKSSETPKPSKYDKMGKLKLEDSFSPVKALPQSFRIPKALADSQKITKPLDIATHTHVPFTSTKDNDRKTSIAQPEEKSSHSKDIAHSSRDSKNVKLKYSKNAVDRNPPKEQGHHELDRTAVLHTDVTRNVETPSIITDQLEEEGSAPSDDGKTIPPLCEVQIGDFTLAVTKLLLKKSDIDIPTLECFSNISDAITEKCAWWLAKCDKEPPEVDESRFPILDSGPSSICSDSGSDISLLGDAINSDTLDDADKGCQVHEISSTSQRPEIIHNRPQISTCDPDKVDEFCGRSLLQAKIRSSTGQKFRDLFHLRAGALYEKENFQAKCNLCNQLIVGKRELAKHVRGTIHKRNLRKIDPEMDQSASSPTPDSSGKKVKIEENKFKNTDNGIKESKPTVSPTKIKSSPRSSVTKKDSSSNLKAELTTTSNGLTVRIPAECDPKRRRVSKSPQSHNRSDSHSKRRYSKSRSRSRERRKRRTRSKSRSPVRVPRSPTELFKRKGGRSRSPEHSIRRGSRKSRSPRRRRQSTSDEYSHRRRSPRHHSKRGRRTQSRSRSPPLPKKDNKEFHEKLCLTAEGKWSTEMEKEWNLMEAEEAMFREQFIDKRKSYVAAPEDHPRYAAEWTEFWERRYQEVEKEGKDPEAYDFIIEWKDYWSKRLNQLLQDEADEKIHQIKVKYGMDYESLRNLRKSELPMTAAPANQGPVTVFRNGSVDCKGPIVMTVNSNSSHASIVDVSSGMSIASVDMIIQGESAQVEGKKTAVSIEDFKSKWEAMTRPKTERQSRTVVHTNPEDTTFVPEFSVTTPFSQQQQQHNIALSDSTSTSEGSFDFMGFDLVQVLRLMCQLEDQLSFLAPRVVDYYKKAEELELKKTKGSLILLNNEELVTVLFQARDRFMSMIRSNVLPRDTLKKINLTVYGLNAILDAPQCQKFRPKLPNNVLVDLDSDVSVKQEPLDISVDGVTTIRKEQNDPTISTAESNELSSILNHVSSKQKSAIASEIAKYLFLVGGQGMSDSDLQQFVIKLISPIAKSNEETDAQKPEIPVAATTEQKKVDLNAFDINREQRPQTLLGHDYTHSYDMRISGVSSSKAVGSALPHISYRAGSEEPPDTRLESLQNTRDRRPAHENDVYDNSIRPQPSRGNSDGRRSPFSRRELAMNPVADRGRY